MFTELCEHRRENFSLDDFFCEVTCGCEQGRLVISACYNREDAIHGTHCGIRTPKAEAKPKLESEADEEREHEGGRDVPR